MHTGESRHLSCRRPGLAAIPLFPPSTVLSKGLWPSLRDNLSGGRASCCSPVRPLRGRESAARSPGPPTTDLGTQQPCKDTASARTGVLFPLPGSEFCCYLPHFPSADGCLQAWRMRQARPPQQVTRRPVCCEGSACWTRNSSAHGTGGARRLDGGEAFAEDAARGPTLAGARSKRRASSLA